LPHFEFLSDGSDGRRRTGGPGPLPGEGVPDPLPPTPLLLIQAWVPSSGPLQSPGTFELLLGVADANGTDYGRCQLPMPICF